MGIETKTIQKVKVYKKSDVLLDLTHQWHGGHGRASCGAAWRWGGAEATGQHGGALGRGECIGAAEVGTCISGLYLGLVLLSV